MADSSGTDQTPDAPSAADVLTVTELNERIAAFVKEMPALHGVRCIGEVTDLHQNSTALYFTLTDGDAELPCMLWANRYRNMDIDLEDGTEVILEGDIDYWVEGGKSTSSPGRSSSPATVTRQPQWSDSKPNSKIGVGSMKTTNNPHRDFQTELASSLRFGEMHGMTSKTRSTIRTLQSTSW